MMNWEQIEYHWDQVQDRIKVTWGKLSEDDLTTITGSREQLGHLLQQRYGLEKLQAEQRVDEFARELTL
jgi:uncharacterized protein YjbJ (UPF0337 family)